MDQHQEGESHEGESRMSDNQLATENPTDNAHASTLPLFDIKRATRKPETWCCIKLIAPTHEDREWTSDDAIGAWCTVCNVQIHFKKGSINSVARHMQSKHQQLMDKFKEHNIMAQAASNDEEAEQNSNGKRGRQTTFRVSPPPLNKHVKTGQATAAITIVDEPEVDHLNAWQASGVQADDDILLKMNQRLLEAVATNKFGIFSQLCADDLTCIVPESKGIVIQGSEFQRFICQSSSTISAKVFTTNTQINEWETTQP